MKTVWRVPLKAAIAAEIIVNLGVLLCSASTPKPSPDPNSSCASAEYQADKEAMETQPASGEVSSGPKVVLGNVAGRINTSEQLRMGRQVTVCVQGLYDWIYVQKNRAADLRLFIGGQILASVAPSSLSPPGQEYVNFILQPDSPDSPDWKAWVAIVDASRHSADHKLTISVAQGTQIFESEAVTTVMPYPKYSFSLAMLLILLLAALCILSWKTTLLRYTVGAETKEEKKAAPFSLGLVQMAFWFYLAVAAYVYICASTLQIYIPMGSILGLLGISATTGLAAVAVDARKTSKTNALTAEQSALQSMLSGPGTSPAPGSAAEKDLVEKKSRLAVVEARLKQQPAAVFIPGATGCLGFFQDILNDGDGISFHRFQIAVWTIVLGCVFVWGVYRNMSMPEFDASLLTLMGISSGTYIGFKFPEAPKK